MTTFAFASVVPPIVQPEGVGGHRTQQLPVHAPVSAPVQAPAQANTVQSLDAGVHAVNPSTPPVSPVSPVGEVSVTPQPVAPQERPQVAQVADEASQNRTAFRVPEAMDRAIQVLVDKVLSNLLNSDADPREALSRDADRTPLASVFA